jgi:hypothetical protein
MVALVLAVFAQMLSVRRLVEIHLQSQSLLWGQALIP